MRNVFDVHSKFKRMRERRRMRGGGGGESPVVFFLLRLGAAALLLVGVAAADGSDVSVGLKRCKSRGVEKGKRGYSTRW